MTSAALGSGCHLFAVMLGVSSVFMRGRAYALVAAGKREALASAFRCDNVWGIAGLILWPSGLLRAFGGLEKGESFYLHNGAFILKMSIFAVVVALEMWPMFTQIAWRIREKKGDAVDDDVLLKTGKHFRNISFAQAALLVAMIFVAPFMARGALMFS
jgi:putative membrane protein